MLLFENRAMIIGNLVENKSSKRWKKFKLKCNESSLPNSYNRFIYLLHSCIFL